MELRFGFDVLFYGVRVAAFAVTRSACRAAFVITICVVDRYTGFLVGSSDALDARRMNCLGEMVSLRSIDIKVYTCPLPIVVPI